MTIIKHCPICGKEMSVTVKDEDYVKYQNGALVQNCFPYLSPMEREIIITGICPACWDNMFGNEE